MPALNAIKVTIGKESTAGTAVTTTAVVPIKGLPSLDRKIEKTVDPVIIGAGMAAGETPVSASVKGPIPLSPRSCAGFGQLLKGALGAETLLSNVIGVVRMRYKGAQASCKIVAAATTLTSYIGALGSESLEGSAPSGFGTTGVYTITPGTTTIATLVSAIAGYTNYECQLVAGAGASTIQSIATGTWQAKGKWLIVTLIGSATGVYGHRFTPDLAIANERPAFSVQHDLGTDNLKYAGCSVGKISLSAALKALLDGSVDLLGFTEATGVGASGLTLGDSKPFIFGGGVSSVGSVDYNFVRSMSAEFDNGLKEDGYGQASLDRAYHAKGLFAASGDLKLRLDATSYLERAKVASGVIASELFIFLAAEGKCVGTSSVQEALIIEIPYAEHSDFNFEDNGGVVDCSLSWKGYYPSGAYYYDPPVTITLLSADNAVY